MRLLPKSRAGSLNLGLMVGIIIGGLLALPLPNYKGFLAPLGNGFNAVLVSNNGPNVIEMLFDKGMSYSSANATSVHNIDQVEAVLNAYGTAQELLGRQTKHGILLNNVFSNSTANKLGLKNGDILTLPESTGFPVAKSLSSYSSNYLQDVIRRGGLVTLYRDGIKLKEIRLPESVNKDLGYAEVASTAIPKDISLPLNLVLAQGSSSGLALSLYFLDLEYDGMLSDGMKVVATGSVITGSKGNRVVSIGSLEDKYRAYLRSKADMFFIPLANKFDILPQEAGSSDNVYLVDTVEEAVKILCSKGSDDKVCQLRNFK